MIVCSGGRKGEEEVDRDDIKYQSATTGRRTDGFVCISISSARFINDTKNVPDYYSDNFFFVNAQNLYEWSYFQ